jgi:hypothetical protein
LSSSYKKVVAAPAAWSPTDVAGLKIWYDFSDITTMFTDAGVTQVSSDGDLIQQINDKSGNGNHATQAVGVDRPTYKVNIQNSLSAGYFDSDNLDIPADFGVSGSGNRTVVHVGLASEQDDYLFGFGNSSNYQAFRARYRSAGPGLRIEIYGEGYTSSLNNYNNWNLHGFILDGTTLSGVTLYENASSESASGSQTINTATTPNHLMADNAGANEENGYTGEFLVYDSALSGTDWTNLTTYLNNKWSLY